MQSAAIVNARLGVGVKTRGIVARPQEIVQRLGPVLAALEVVGQEACDLAEAPVIALLKCRAGSTMQLAALGEQQQVGRRRPGLARA